MAMVATHTECFSLKKQETLDYAEAILLEELSEAHDKDYLRMLIKVAELRPDEPASSLLDEDLATA